MSHSTDLRSRVLDYIEAGGLIKSACVLFKVSRSSIQRWRDKKEETGSISPVSRINAPYKINDIALQSYIQANPDAYLSEMAVHFGVTTSGLWRALKRLKITRKKVHALCRKRWAETTKLLNWSCKVWRRKTGLYWRIGHRSIYLQRAWLECSLRKSALRSIG